MVFAPSIVYDRSDPWVTLLRRFSFLPVMPVSGDGQARFQPIWAADAARCVVARAARRTAAGTATSSPGPETLDLRRHVGPGQPRRRPAAPARPRSPAADPRRDCSRRAPFSASPCLQPGRRRS